MAFNDLGKRIQKTGQGAIDRTKRSAETARLNSTISGMEKEITAEYTEIGRIYYQKHAADENDPDLVTHFQTVTDKLRTIEDCQNQISELKGFRKCSNCGKEISRTAVFCNYCGARQVPVYSTDGVRVCPNCGAELQEDQLFCTECGTRVDIVEEAPKTERHCINCGTILGEKALYCPICGQRNELPGTAAAEAAVPTMEEIVSPIPESDAEPELEPDPEFDAPETDEPVPGPEPVAEEEIPAEEEIMPEPEFDPDPEIAEEIVSDPDFDLDLLLDHEPEPGELLFCAYCGAALDPSDMFCTKCGKKVEKQE